MELLPLAPVIGWDAKDVQVRCPYCGSKHVHGTGISDYSGWTLTGETRESHCHIHGSRSKQYRLHYPFEDDREPTSWEISKDQGKFITVGLAEEGQSDDDASDEEDRASISEDGHPVIMPDDKEDPGEAIGRSADDAWEELMRQQSFRLQRYVSHCVLNELSELRALMSQYDDDFISETGNNGIALTAAEGHFRLLQ